MSTAGQEALGLISELGHGISLLGEVWASSQHGGFEETCCFLVVQGTALLVTMKPSRIQGGGN